LRHYPRRRSREHNLKGVTLGIPKNQITVFVGVSGFGKSSIVFDTIAVEAQRQLYATFPLSSAVSCPGTSGPTSTPSRT
jgi:excinuclease UvrABC ATPase subunit